jgi:hypothetical protein
MGPVIKSGTVEVKKPFIVKEFDEDDGWVEIKIKPGTYEYRVQNVRGWKPRQLKIDGEWQDVSDTCEELEKLLAELDETTTVSNIAPTKDYMGHVDPVVTDFGYADDTVYDSGDNKLEKDDDKNDDSWTSPIGRLLAGESVRSVLLRGVSSNDLEKRIADAKKILYSETPADQVIGKPYVCDDFVEFDCKAGGDLLQYRIYRDGSVVER